jgi:hypothetical protein
MLVVMGVTVVVTTLEALLVVVVVLVLLDKMRLLNKTQVTAATDLQLTALGYLLLLRL